VPRNDSSWTIQVWMEMGIMMGGCDNEQSSLRGLVVAGGGCFGREMIRMCCVGDGIVIVIVRLEREGTR
jgi:hypothetical protein